MSYQRKTGDLEIRILKDGRLVMIAPDEKLLEAVDGIRKLTLNEKQFEKAENDTNE